MAKQTINIGTTANDGTGDPIRSAFDKSNDNFTELYSKPDLSLAANILTLTKADGTTDTVDLSSYLDEDARAIASGTIDGAGIVTFTRDDASTFTLDLSSLLDDTVANDATITLTAGSGLTGGGSFTTDQASADTVTFDVNVDDSTIGITTDTLEVKDNGIDHDQLAVRFTDAKTDYGSITTTTTIDWSVAAIHELSMGGAATLNFSNYKKGQVIDLIINGDYTITLGTVSGTPSINQVGTSTYDGTTDNIIQVLCTDDDATPTFLYAVGAYTTDTNPA